VGIDFEVVGKEGCIVSLKVSVIFKVTDKATKPLKRLKRKLKRFKRKLMFLRVMRILKKLKNIFKKDRGNYG